ncbi:universal stress protein [Halegenticoccus soli]|uniref:universal stress protein n=1 Tax=Halegenticoccus soli TaxID=1985678 RepID=UPI0018ED2B00|nr:universal stress protein [Halegenticoccus soli]
MSRHVLVPHDGGELADAALSFALRGITDATFTVLHVVELFADHTAAGIEDRAGD